MDYEGTRRRARQLLLRRGGRSEVREDSDKTAVAEQVSAVIKSGHPFAYCFPCLARVMMWPEKRIRETAQLLVVLKGFHVRRRTCYQCERTDDMIVMSIE